MKPHPYFAPALAMAAVLLVLDQLSKQWIVSNYSLFQGITLTPFLNIVRVHNPGAAFSFLADAGGWQHYFFTALAFGVSAYLLSMMWQQARRWPNVAMGLIISGALGNVIDRLRFAYVVDFVDVHAMGWHWPAFNVADSCICVGAVLLIACEWKNSKAPAAKK
jgi:signal peptidase II